MPAFPISHIVDFNPKEAICTGIYDDLSDAFIEDLESAMIDQIETHLFIDSDYAPNDQDTDLDDATDEVFRKVVMALPMGVVIFKGDDLVQLRTNIKGNLSRAIENY